jgi:hypothetical protein
MGALWSEIEWSEKESRVVEAFDQARAQGQGALDEFFGSIFAPKTEKMTNKVIHHALRQTDLAGAQAAVKYLREQDWSFKYHDPKTGWLIYHEATWKRSFAPGSPARAIADWLVADNEMDFYICHGTDSDGNVTAHNHDRLIHNAIEMNSDELFDWILAHGGDATGWGGKKKGNDPTFTKEWPDETPLALAARFRRPKMVAKILAAGANPTTFVRRGDERLHKPPLAAAIDAGDWECAKLIASAQGTGADWKADDDAGLLQAKDPARAPASSPDHARIWVAAQANWVACFLSKKQEEAKTLSSQACDAREAAIKSEETAKALERQAERDAQLALARAQGLAAQAAAGEPAAGKEPRGSGLRATLFARLAGLAKKNASRESASGTLGAEPGKPEPLSLELQAVEMRAKSRQSHAEADRLGRARDAVRLGNAIVSGDAQAARAAMEAIASPGAMTHCGLPIAFLATALAVAAFDSPKIAAKARELSLASVGRPLDEPDGLSCAARLSVLVACAQSDGPAGEAFRKQLRAPMGVLGGLCCAHVAALFNAPAVLRVICEATGPLGIEFSKDAPEPLATAVFSGAREAAEAILSLGAAGGDPERASEAVLACAQGERLGLFQSLVETLEASACRSPEQAGALSRGLSLASDFVSAQLAAGQSAQEGDWKEWARTIERARLSLEAGLAARASQPEGAEQEAPAHRGGLRL